MCQSGEMDCQCTLRELSKNRCSGLKQRYEVTGDDLTVHTPRFWLGITTHTIGHGGRAEHWWYSGATPAYYSLLIQFREPR